MKLAVLGGGGVRSPLFVAATLRRVGQIHLDELCLMDTRPEKLDLMGELCRQVARRMGSRVRITTTREARAALEGAAYIVTTIRVGEEQGRVLDERIALRHGVLGQETTGPGGFAMAMRSIPAILEYARLAEEVCPGAWMFNFTNPAGLVTQALHSQGFNRTVGICDGANQAQIEAARFLGVRPETLKAEVFGLNHLSWTRRLEQNGQDLLPALLANDDFLASTSQHMFAPELVRRIGMWLNEYLFYFYYADRALAAIQADELTRGEEVLRLNQVLLDRLKAIAPQNDPEHALRVYAAYDRRRISTYMHYAWSENSLTEDESWADSTLEDFAPEEGEGYAGVALNIIQAFERGGPLYTALNVPNQGAIGCLEPEDVVEVSCVVEKGVIQPRPVGAIPEAQELLVRSVKRYERLAVEAILTRSRAKAVEALMAHPLVLSYPLAHQLVDEYITAHGDYVGEWQA